MKSIGRFLRRNLTLVASVVLLLLFMPYFVLWFYYAQAVPEPKTNYLEQLNEIHASYPMEKRAWPIYRDALKPYGEHFDSLLQRHEIHDSLGEFQTFAATEPEQFNQLVAELEPMEGLLAALRSGSELPTLGFELQPTYREYSDEDRLVLYPMAQHDPTDFGDRSKQFPQRISRSIAYSAISSPCQHVDMIRRLWRLLRVDKAVAIATNDPERVVRNIEASLGLSRQAVNIQITIESAVALELFRISLDELSELLDLPELSWDANQKNRLVAALHQPDLFAYFEPANELYLNYDLVQRIYTDNGMGDGHLTSDYRLYIRFLDDMYSREASFQRPDSAEGAVIEWIMQPFIVFSTPTRAQVMQVLHEHERLLHDAWQPPYDRQKLHDAIEAIKASKLPVGLNKDYIMFVRFYDHIVELNAQRENIIKRLD